MNRERVRKLIDDLRIAVVGSGPHGIEIRRVGAVVSPPSAPDMLVLSESGIGATWCEERWRVVSGGGIAGNSEEWWIRPVAARGAVHGPYRTVRDLTKALRAWRRWELQR